MGTLVGASVRTVGTPPAVPHHQQAVEEEDDSQVPAPEQRAVGTPHAGLTHRHRLEKEASSNGHAVAHTAADVDAAVAGSPGPLAPHVVAQDPTRSGRYAPRTTP